MSDATIPRMEMPDGEFKEYFSSLEKMSDRARSVIYAFIIIYIAILIYALNSFAYPAKQFVFDSVKRDVACIREAELSRVSDFCKKAYGPEFFKRTPPTLEKEMEESLWRQQLSKAYDDTLSLRTFQFPIFGLTTDRDQAWIVFPFIGILGYYIVWISLHKVVNAFNFLSRNSNAESPRLRLILSTQMLTSPLSAETLDLSRFHQNVWKMLSTLVFLIPIIVSVMIIMDHTNLFGVLRLSDGTRAPEKIRFLGESPWFSVRLAIEAAMLVFQCVLLLGLIRTGGNFGRDQARVQREVDLLESSA